MQNTINFNKLLYEALTKNNSKDENICLITNDTLKKIILN